MTQNWGIIANILENRNKIQKDLDRLKHWAKNKRMKFNRDKYKVLRLGKNPNAHLQNGADAGF